MTHSDFWSKIKYIITSRRFYEYTFISVILSTFMLWLFKIFYEGNLSEQFNIFFRGCSDFLADILNVVGYSSQRDVYNNTMYTGLAEKAYPPLTYVFAYFLSRLVDMGQYYKLNYFLWMYQEPRFLIIYLILAIITMIMVYELICSCKTGCHSLKIVTAVTCLLSAPMLYSLERANTIIITMFCTMFFSFFYDSQKCLLRQLAYLSFAVAVSLKLTPAVLGIFLLHKRQWKGVVCVIIYSLILFLTPFAFFEGGLSNLPKMMENMQLNLEVYTSNEGCTLLASILHFVPSPPESLPSIMKAITYIVSIVFLAASFMLPFKWERMMAVSLTLVILPSHSGYYCLLYLFPPMIAFLNETNHKYPDLLFLLAILFIMQDVRGEWSDNLFNYHLALLIMTITLFSYSVLAIIRQFKPLTFQKYNSN